MSFLFYGGAAILATSVATSVATKVVTNAPRVMVNILSKTGINDYFYSTAKSSYRKYYKLMVSEGPLYDVIMKILSKNTDKAYGLRQNPDCGKGIEFKNKDDAKGDFRELSEDEIHRMTSWIVADILCFRNTTSFYDYSSFGRARVRFYYDGTFSKGQAVMMCQKKFELDDFHNLLLSPEFDDATSLTFVGIG